MSKRITRKQLQRIIQEEKRIVQRKTRKNVIAKKRYNKSNKQLAQEALDTGLYQLILQEENKLFPKKLDESRFTIKEFKFLRDMKRKWDSMKGSVSSSMDAAKNMGKGFADMIGQFSDDKKASALTRAKEYILKQMTPVIQKSTEEAIGALKKEYEKAGVEHTDESVKMEVMAALQGALGGAVKDSAEGAKEAAKEESTAAKEEDKGGDEEGKEEEEGKEGKEGAPSPEELEKLPSAEPGKSSKLRDNIRAKL